MSTSVTVEDKKVFIQWLLKSHRLKRRECVWILNYLLSHEDLLKNVRFVEEAHYCPRAIVMSVTSTDSIPFRFYKGSLMTADAEKAFHDLRLHPEEDMFIQVNFPSKNTCKEYVGVLEVNKYNPHEIKSEVSAETESLIDEILEKTNRQRILSEIDVALDNGDKERFMELCKMLNNKTENKRTINFSA